MDPLAFTTFEPLPAKMRGRHPGYGVLPFEMGPFPMWAAVRPTDGQDCSGFEKISPRDERSDLDSEFSQI